MLPSRPMRTTTARAIDAMEQPASVPAALVAARSVDALLVRVARDARVLPALIPENAAIERARLIELVGKGGAPQPRWEFARRRVELPVWRALDEARALVRDRLSRPLRERYLAKLDELEVDLAMIEAVGDPVRV